RISRYNDVAAEVRDAFHFARQVNRLLPIGNCFGGLVADAADLEQLGSGGTKDGGSIAEMFEQLTHTNRTNMFDQVQRHEGFARLHRKREAWHELAASSSLLKQKICVGAF